MVTLLPANGELEVALAESRLGVPTWIKFCPSAPSISLARVESLWVSAGAGTSTINFLFGWLTGLFIDGSLVSVLAVGVRGQPQFCPIFKCAAKVTVLTSIYFSTLIE